MIESKTNATEDILTGLNILEPREIADAIRKEGITGVPTTSNSCPLARYLNKKTNYIHHVQKTFVAIYDGGERVGFVTLPQSVGKFVRQYDAGKYLFLDAGRPIE